MDHDVTPIGTTNYRNSNRVFGIRDADRLQHLYLVGKSGTGKSTLLANMAASDIRRGNGVCVLDPHGDIVRLLAANVPEGRKKDLVYFDATDAASTVSFNPLKAVHPNTTTS